MTLIIGGAGQGKLAYALEQLHVGQEAVASDLAQEGAILAGLERWLRQETDPMPALERLLEVRPHVVILCNEVGSGVVPMDREERTWRERVGRTCCALAERAGCVIRMYCGIPSIIKGEPEWN